MKKHKSISISLKFDKTNIANLNQVNGGGSNSSNEFACYTKVLDDCHTITVRPDSIQI